MTPERKSALDRPIARVVAAGVILAVIALLAFIHREDLFPPEKSAVAADDPVAQCLATRAADIDKMAAEGTISEDQATLFKSRAEALCQAQVGGGNAAPPPLPTQ